MADLDLDAIESRAAYLRGMQKDATAEAYTVSVTDANVCGTVGHDDIPALVVELREARAEVADLRRFCAEWSTLEAERDEARAAIAAVRALCDHADSGLHAGLTMVSVAAVRGAILAALDVRDDPSATTGGAS